MITKTKLLQQLDTLPEQIQIEELIEELILMDKIENRIGLSENNETLSEEEMNYEIEQWLK